MVVSEALGQAGEIRVLPEREDVDDFGLARLQRQTASFRWVAA